MLFSGTTISQRAKAKGLAKFVCHTMLHYIEVLFHIFYCYWGTENHSLYRGLHYIEVCFIEVHYIEVLLLQVF